MTKIMVVDNEIDTVNLVKMILENDKYEVMTALSGKECLEKFVKGKARPDLILLDIMMPDLSGYDVYQRIRKKDKKVKVAFLTVLEVSEERKKALMNDGISDYILKPFTKDELLLRVKKILTGMIHMGGVVADKNNGRGQ